VSDRGGNGVCIVLVLRPQISGFDEFRDHLVRWYLVGKKHDFAHYVCRKPWATSVPNRIPSSTVSGPAAMLLSFQKKNPKRGLTKNALGA
jgi:hypothetical protein